MSSYIEIGAILAFIAYLTHNFFKKKESDIKLELLAELDTLGVGYSSKKSCDEDDMGLSLNWDDVKNVDVDQLRELLKEVKK